MSSRNDHHVGAGQPLGPQRRGIDERWLHRHGTQVGEQLQRLAQLEVWPARAAWRGRQLIPPAGHPRHPGAPRRRPWRGGPGPRPGWACRRPRSRSRLGGSSPPREGEPRNELSTSSRTHLVVDYDLRSDVVAGDDGDARGRLGGSRSWRCHLYGHVRWTPVLSSFSSALTNASSEASMMLVERPWPLTVSP